MRENDEAVVDAEAFAVRRTISIAAPVETVWRAITEPGLISRWFGEAELSGGGAGATGSLSWADAGSYALRIESVDPPREIVYRWAHEPAAAGERVDLDAVPSTVFAFALAAIEGGTALTVVETGFGDLDAAAAALEDHRKGWNSELDELVALLGGS